jgi:hypothetical protein
MTRFITRSFALVMLVFVGLSLPSVAQSTRIIKVKIPFEFTFGGRVFPAGEYSLLQPEEHILRLRDANGKTAGQVFTQGVEANMAAASTVLRFQVAEGQHNLFEVWHEQDSSGERVYPAKAQALTKPSMMADPDTTGANQR